MKARIFRLILSIYRPLFVRKKLYIFNRLLFDLSLRGLGVLNFENHDVSGETHFFRRFLAGRKGLLVMDVGANDGEYAVTVLKYCPDALIYSFEPHPAAYRRLQENASQNNFHAFNLGFSDKAGAMQLFDRPSNDGGTQHASLYREVIEDIHKTNVTTVGVDISTIDTFVAERNIAHIHLLKIDTEGNEFLILKGAQRTIARNMVDIVQIEFNEMNTVSRVFFKDFFALFVDYECYRLLPDGLLPIRKYFPLYCELFAFQNVLFVRNGLSTQPLS